MSARIVAPEETRDALRGMNAGAVASVADLADVLAVSPSTVRRHLAELRQRGQVAPVVGGPRGRWTLTATGRAASLAAEPL